MSLNKYKAASLKDKHDQMESLGTAHKVEKKKEIKKVVKKVKSK